MPTTPLEPKVEPQYNPDSHPGVDRWHERNNPRPDTSKAPREPNQDGWGKAKP